MIYASTLHSPRRLEQEYLAGWQRARAELNNFRRRQSEQATTSREQTRREIITELLPLADNFQAITRHVPLLLKDDPWAAGVLHVARQLDTLLAEQGITPINKINEPFDPMKHEAIKKTKTNTTASGHVIEVLQAGYAWRGEVIRPAKVKVAA